MSAAACDWVALSNLIMSSNRWVNAPCCCRCCCCCCSRSLAACCNCNCNCSNCELVCCCICCWYPSSDLNDATADVRMLVAFETLRCTMSDGCIGRLVADDWGDGLCRFPVVDDVARPLAKMASEPAVEGGFDPIMEPSPLSPYGAGRWDRSRPAPVVGSTGRDPLRWAEPLGSSAGRVLSLWMLEFSGSLGRSPDEPRSSADRVLSLRRPTAGGIWLGLLLPDRAAGIAPLPRSAGGFGCRSTGVTPSTRTPAPFSDGAGDRGNPIATHAGSPMTTAGSTVVTPSTQVPSLSSWRGRPAGVTPRSGPPPL